MFTPVRDLGRLYPAFFVRYLQKDPEIMQHLSKPYQHVESYRDLAETLTRRQRSWNTPRDLLAEQNAGNLQAVSGELLGKIKDKNTVFVITGQQPGLLTGPLYGIYKAITAVKLAERLEKVLQKPVQPLFWVANEDHNVFDLFRFYLQNPQGKISRIRMSFPGFGLPVGEIQLAKDHMFTVLERLQELTPQTAHKKEVMEDLHEIAARSSTLSDWFIHLMQHLFHHRELGFIDPLQLSKKGAYISLLLKTLEVGPQVHQAIAEAEKQLETSGFAPQVKRTGQESFIMIVWKGRRYALNRDKDQFFTAKGELSLTRYELMSMIQENPGIFSPNVLLRPIFQDSLFPNLAYVPGPGELAYFAQIPGVYRLFGLEMPVLFPRLGVTLRGARQQKRVQAQGLTFEETLAYAQSVCENPAKKAGESPRQQENREYFWPRCSPQERVFTLFPFLIEYGYSFWNRFCQAFPGEEGHYIYDLGESEIS